MSGDAYKALILFGSSGSSLKKVAAETAADIAQMALVKAVWEGAEAAAMYALYFFSHNPDHLRSAIHHGKAALGYGLAAAVAGGAGRAIAGNAFASDSGAGGGGSGATGSDATQYAPFKYNSGAPIPASQAFAQGSRSLASKDDINRLSAAIESLHQKIGSVSKDEIITSNPNAVGTSLQEAIQRHHPIRGDITSLGSTGLA